MKKHSIPKGLVIAFLALSCIVCIIIAILSFSKREKICQRLRTSNYNCVFLSMFPIDTFQEEDFSYFRAEDVLKLTEVIPNYQTLKSCVKAVSSSGNEVGTIYLGVDPLKVSAQQVLELQASLPGTSFEVIPTYRRLSQWLSDKRADAHFQAYRDFVEALQEKENVRVYSFFSQEWLIADDANYLSGLLLNESVAERIYIYSDALHNCNFNRENTPTIFYEFEQLLQGAREHGYSFPDLSDWDIVFFGDSVMGNYVGHDSIPGLIRDLCNARTYNCGWNGATASGAEVSGGINVLNCYLSGDLTSLPTDSRTYLGLRERLEAEKQPSGRKQLFVIHYGLNDYFQGKPIDNAADPYDAETYCGAIRSMIETLKKQRPEARILLIAPNAVTCFDAGSRILGENGAPLADYVDALLQVADAYHLAIQNDYRDVLPPENAERFLDGEVHPNEYGRYKIAKALAELITVQFP